MNRLKRLGIVLGTMLLFGCKNMEVENMEVKQRNDNTWVIIKHDHLPIGPEYLCGNGAPIDHWYFDFHTDDILHDAVTFPDSISAVDGLNKWIETNSKKDLK